jgi:hypothetical protein
MSIPNKWFFFVKQASLFLFYLKNICLLDLINEKKFDQFTKNNNNRNDRAETDSVDLKKEFIIESSI